MVAPLVIYEETHGLDLSALADAWLHRLDGAERERYAAFRHDRDRRDYLAAHALLIAGRPPVPGRWSLTHTTGFVACAWSLDDDTAIGIDAEPVAAATRLRTMTEVFVAATDDVLIDPVVLWTAKEAVLKARGDGFSGVGGFAVLRELECAPVGRLDDWDIIAIRDARTGGLARAWTRRVGGHVLSVVGDQSNIPPRLTRLPLG